ncbi:MAG: hypothetical protein HY077_14410, partial [Elusimicrobia bacterium]|nr:hypothetical protein [Elusimicrobiota bacterium]
RPIRSSTVEFEPVGGGKPVVLSTGRLLDLLKAQATAFELDDRQYYMAYLSDVDPANAAATGTRSFLIYEEKRFLPKTWRLSEASLPDGVPVSVVLDGAELVLSKDFSGTLTLYPR